MSPFARKNLMVDAEAIRDLARLRGTSESEAVRDAVSVALGTQEMVAALKGLHDIGAFGDFEELFPLRDERPEVRHVAEAGESFGTGRS